MRDFLISTTFCFLVCFIWLFTGCTQNKGDFNSLINQGILPVSPSNAYLGSNLFLGKEAEKSELLYQFLKGRGAPGAIEIVKEDFKNQNILLYYPKQSQYYIAELQADKISYEWIVRGPFMIERDTFRKLSEIHRYQYEASPIIIDGRIMSFVEPTPIPTATATAKPVTPKPTRKAVRKTPLPVATKSDSNNILLVPTTAPISEIPSGPGLNSDQQAIRLSKGLVELTSSGDLIHKVGSDAETLEQLATWYTGDSAKAKAIAEFNGLASGTPLAKGAKIKIPKAISTTEKAMGK